MPTTRSEEYAKIHSLACKAAQEAIKDMKDVGMCGHGYVRVMPGTSGFARWLRKNAGASSVTSGLFKGTHLPANTGQQAYATNQVWVETYAKAVFEQLPQVCVMGLVRAD